MKNKEQDARKAWRWKDGICIIGDTIVGTVQSNVNGTWAHGCRDDWEDTPLGHYKTERQAKEAVEAWVKRNS